jgi:predicted small secreted protein
MKTSTFIVLILFLGISLTMIGCNTIRGFGEDISGSANFVEKKMTGNDGDSSSNPPQWPK